MAYEMTLANAERITEEKMLALGHTAGDWLDYIRKSKDALKAQKCVNYYDGLQEDELTKVLDHPQMGIYGWRERGYRIRYRNTTKMVVKKSAILFNYAPDCYIVDEDGDLNEKETEIFYNIKENCDWDEFWTGFDHILRLMKTSLVFISYDPSDDCYVFDILHRGNSFVITNQARTKMIGLVRCVSDDASAHEAYQIVTAPMYNESGEVTVPGQYIYLAYDKDGVLWGSAEDNPYDIIPAATFHDEDEPRTRFWNTPGYDLVYQNETLNLSMMESEWAISWAKRKQPVTNADIDTSNQPRRARETVENHGAALNSTSGLLRNYDLSETSYDNVISGPDRPVKLIGNGQDAIFFEYKGPDIDIEPLDQVIEGWTKAIAYDWSVRLKVDGNGSAQSGFQLVVEEIDNLELRKQRAKMFQNGFKRFWEAFTAVHNYHHPESAFSEESQLHVEFPEPKLPVEKKTEEEVWSKRIAEGRATEIDYFVEVKGMDRTAAEEKVREIQEFNALKRAANRLEMNDDEEQDSTETAE